MKDLNGTEINNIFELLDQKDEKLVLADEADAVLVFGTTGSGKSTFIQWITGINSDLTSNEVLAGSGEYVIEDKNDKIGSSIVSKTLFPEVVTDVTTGSKFYDLPGFSDTRSSSHDIAASYFTKCVLDHVQNVKMLFTTSYYTVQEGMDRIGFPALLQNMDDLIGDVDKFKNSIALVVTKVDNICVKKEGILVLKPDDTVLEGIATYLSKIKDIFENDLIESGFKNPITEKKRKFRTNAIKIINILLTMDHGDYKNITLFRKPDEKGLLNEIELLTKGRKRVQHMIFANLKYTHSQPNDFGFAISDNSKLEIDGLVTVVNNQITENVYSAAADMSECLKSFVEALLIKINTNNIGALQLSEATAFFEQTLIWQEIVSDSEVFFSQLQKIDGIGKMLTLNLIAFKVENPKKYEKRLLNFPSYFDFFQLFRETSLTVSSISWATPFRSLSNYLTESKQFIKEKAFSLAEDLNSEVTFHVDFIAENIKQMIMDDINRIVECVNLTNNSTKTTLELSYANDCHKKLTERQNISMDLVENLKVVPTPNGMYDILSEALSVMKIESMNDVLSEIFRKTNEFQLLQIVSGTNFSFPSAQWSNSFEKITLISHIENLSRLVENAEKEIKSNVSILLRKLSETIQSCLQIRSSQLEVDKLIDELKRWSLLLVPVKQMIDINPDLGMLIGVVSSSISKLKLNDHSIQTCLFSLKKQDKNLQFLQALQGTSNVVATQDWKSSIFDIIESFEIELKFNVFVMALYESLSQFQIQNDISIYNVMDLSHWGEPGHPQGIHIVKSNFKLFMEKVRELNIEAANNIPEMVPTETQFILLNNVLGITLKNRVNIQCLSPTDSKVVLKANFIRFSDFLDSNGKFKGYGWKHISSLEIHALNTLFIDQDLEASGHRLKLSIITPRLEVIGNRLISLDGIAGDFFPKATNGIFPSGHGEAGSPGLPGVSAGAFFGIVGKLLSSKNLTISANGGQGGPGQSGGDGANGEDGKTPPFSPELLPDSSEEDKEAYERDGFKVEPIERESRALAKFYKISGIDGTKGGDGGSCGAGGLGGFCGEISLVCLTGKSKVMAFRKNGGTGAKGTPGVEGTGGCHGNHRIKKYVYSRNASIFDFVAFLMVNPSSFSSQWRAEHIDFEFRGSAKSGNRKNCISSENPTNPLPAAEIQNAYSILQTFLNFFIENSNDRFVRFSSLKTCEQAITNSEVQKLRDTFGLIEDLKMLVSFSRKSSWNVVSMYESHLMNIENHAANLKPGESSIEFKILLNYLFTATLTLIGSLKSPLDSDLVIDIGGYLDIVMHNIDILRSLNDETRLCATVETLKNNFKAELDMKICEAQSLLQDLTPEFSEISSQFHVQISNLAKETAEFQTLTLQKATNDKIDILKAKKTQLESQLKINTVLKVMKVVSRVSMFFGSAGVAVGIAIEGGTAIVEGLQQGEVHPPAIASTKPMNLQEKIQVLTTSAFELFTLLRTEEDDCLEVTKDIDDLRKVLDELETFKTKVYERLVPLIENMMKDIVNAASNLKTKSRVSLDIVGWQVQSTMKNTSLEIKQFSRGLKMNDAIARSVEKLEQVMTSVVRVYDRIIDYQEQQRLSVYMASLSSISISQNAGDDSDFNNNLRYLQIVIRSNILQIQYNSVLNAFEQWIFPFADNFRKEFCLAECSVSTETDIEALASSAMSQIENIRSKIQKYKTKIEDFDQHIYIAEFSKSKIMKPFFVWKNVEHRSMITRLLSGQAVTVNADIFDSAVEKDAVKFNYIKIDFLSEDPKTQEEVDNELLNFSVSMTHLGNSHYRYDGQFFAIASSSQSLHYSFEKSKHGGAMVGNNVYHKLLAGDIILSPYTMWKLKLDIGHPSSNKSFSSLSKFCDKVDLVLEGKGSYVNTGETKFDVQSYYKSEDSIKLTRV